MASKFRRIDVDETVSVIGKTMVEQIDSQVTDTILSQIDSLSPIQDYLLILVQKRTD